MKISKQEKIKQLVGQANQFPNATIEYNFEIPKMSGVKEDNFLGVPARINKRIHPNDMGKVIYKLS